MAAHDESQDVHLQQLAEVARQVKRARRGEAVRLRQRAALLNLIAESMAEFGISNVELMTARRAIHERTGNKTLESDALDMQDD